jgi:hypothetical protein
MPLSESFYKTVTFRMDHNYTSLAVGDTFVFIAGEIFIGHPTIVPQN